MSYDAKRAATEGEKRLATWRQSARCSRCGKLRGRRVNSETFSNTPFLCDMCNPTPLRECKRPDTRARNILWNGVHSDHEVR